jgi:hypothetical protein
MRLVTIAAILSELYETREERAKSKFSGVYLEDGVYRVHVDYFVPRAFRVDKTLWDDVASVVEIAFPLTMKWDKQSLWLTMKDPK